MDLPNSPFFNDLIKTEGGGVDYLGLAAVNLGLLGDYLLPGLNNQTKDVGTYFLATWISWKFEQLVANKKTSPSKHNFAKFSQGIEVLIAHSYRQGSPSNNEWGTPRNRIGNQQEIDLNSNPPSFEIAKRKPSNTLFSAPLYGPSTRYLNLIEGIAIDDQGRSTGIQVSSKDRDTATIARVVDTELRSCDEYNQIDQTDFPVIDQEAADALGNAGLNPSYFRSHGSDAREAFRRKLLPSGISSSGYPRTLTARLIVATLQSAPDQNVEEIRDIWYTGRLTTGEFSLSPDLEMHRRRWAVFLGRQYQRWIIELFHKVFEDTIREGVRNLRHLVTTVLAKWSDSPSTFQELLENESSWFEGEWSIEAVSKSWNEEIGPGHSSSERVLSSSVERSFKTGMKMLARWWLRTQLWFSSYEMDELLNRGSTGRLSMTWFSTWLDERRKLPLQDFVYDLFQTLVFSQHLRVALARFDGQNQRLRFVTGDEGLELTDISKTDESRTLPGWMADRLEAFINLLEDLGLVARDKENRFQVPVKGQEQST